MRLIPFLVLSEQPTNCDSVTAVQQYLRGQLNRTATELLPEEWGSILIGVGDLGDLAAYPCRLVLPFHYPATIAELDRSERDHFAFPDKKWKLQWEAIPEFAEQYKKYSEMEDKREQTRAEAQQLQRRIQVLREACGSFDPALTIFGIECDAETWWEVLTFHVSGPRIPRAPAPVSDVQILSRLRRHTHNYIGMSAFGIEKGVIIEMKLDGACTNDTTIDLLRGIPNLRSLLHSLRKLSLQSTLVTARSLKFLARELPDLEVAYSYYLDD